MVRIARLAGVLDSDGDRVALAADAVVGADVVDADLATAVGRLVLVVHVGVAEGGDEGTVAVGVTARASNATLEVNGAETSVAAVGNDC